MSQNKVENGPEYYKNYVLRNGLKENRAYYFWFGDGTGFYGTPHEFGFYADRRFKVRPDDTYEFNQDTDDSGEILSYPVGADHESIEIGAPQSAGDIITMHRGKKDPRF